MKLADAPPPGWYPDPVGGVRLRWWDGTDWTERYRSRPGMSAEQLYGAVTPGASVTDPVLAGTRARAALSSSETAEIVAQVRQAARAEVDRAADLFSARARDATREIQPLITQYTSRFVRGFKIAAALLTLLVIGWFVFELVAQATFFDWLGDRIDNVTDRSGAPPPTPM